MTLNIRMVGDSLSVGVSQVLRNQPGWALYGEPVVGASLLSMKAQAHRAQSDEIVHIMGGTNDAAGGASTAKMFSDLQNLVDIAKSTGAQVVVTPPPPSQKPWNTELNALRQRIGGLRGAYVGRQDFPASKLSPDGVHPNNYQELANIVGHNIESALHPIGTTVSENATSRVVLATTVVLGAYWLWTRQIQNRRSRPKKLK